MKVTFTGSNPWGHLLFRVDHYALKEFDEKLFDAMLNMPDDCDTIAFDVEVTKGQIVFKSLGDHYQE